jgi:YD repeat-containing protein
MVVPGTGYPFFTYMTGALFLDMDGDGQPDLVQSNVDAVTTTNQVWLSSAKSEFVSAVHNALGGEVDAQYDCSLRISGTHQIAFPVQVLTGMQSLDGRGGSINSTFSYDQGLYDFSQKEFLGFGAVTAADVEGNKTVTLYHQNKDASGAIVPANAFKGRAYKMQRLDSSGHMLTQQETRWEYKNPATNVYAVRPAWIDNTVYDVTPAVTTEVAYTYDDLPSGPGYGNLIKTINRGDLAITGDERTDTINYTQNASASLLSFPYETTTFGPDGQTMLADTIYIYDGTPNAISHGNVTQVKRWLNPGNRYVSAQSQYNAFGQVTDVTDPLSHTTHTDYDSFGYPSAVTNALSQTVHSTYDPGTGAATSDTDINGQQTLYRYDALGRVTKIIGPLDSDSFPSIEYNYHT